MGNTPSTPLNEDFLPGDQVRIVEADKLSEKVFFINSVAVEESDITSKKEHSLKKAVVVEDENHTVVGVFKPDQLFVLNIEQNKRRRIEYKLLNNYVQVCKSRKINPNDHVLTIYSEHVKQGVPVFKLELSKQNLTDDDTVAIAELLKGESALRKLDLSQNQVSELGCRIVCQTLRKSFAIRELDLSNNPLMLKSASAIASLLEHNTALAYINLDNTHIGTAGCDQVIEALLRNPNSSLVKLDIRRCGAGDKQVASLCKLAQKLKTLSFVELYPPSEADDLQQAVTDAWLSYDGWIQYGNMHSFLLENKEFVQGNPETMKPKPSVNIKTADDAFNFLMYNLSVVKQAYVDPFLAQNTSLPIEKPTEDKIKSFDEWQKQKQIANEWKQLTSEQVKLLQLEKQLKMKQEKPLCVEAEISDNLVMDVQGKELLPNQEQKVEVKVSEADWVVLDDEFGEATETKEKPKLKLAPIETTPAIVPTNEPTLTCAICLDSKASSQFYILDHCNHKFCTDCIRNYVVLKIENFETDTIVCPECHGKISNEEVKQLIHLRKTDSSYSLHERFEEYNLKKALLSMKNLVWCPNPRCSNAMILDPSKLQPNISQTPPATPSEQGPELINYEDTIPLPVTCSACNTNICPRCHDVYHPSQLKCEEWKQQKQTKNEQLFEEYKKQHAIKPCPKCHVMTEKSIRTCNEVKCVQCSCNWCFACGSEIDDVKIHFSKGTCWKWNFADFSPFAE